MHFNFSLLQYIFIFITGVFLVMSVFIALIFEAKRFKPQYIEEKLLVKPISRLEKKCYWLYFIAILFVVVTFIVCSL